MNISIICDYLDRNFTRTDDYDECIKEIRKLSRFLNMNKIQPSIDDIIILLKNKVLEEHIKVIFNKNKETILEGRIDQLFSIALLNDMIDIYCMINKIEIKEPEVEITSKDLKNGAEYYFKGIGKIKLLSAEEEKNLALRIKNGDDDAREKFIEANLRLVPGIAKDYVRGRISIMDLIQEGNIGLMKAVDKFDPNRNLRFSTYAYYYIRVYCRKAISKYSDGVEKSSYMMDIINKHNREVDNLAKELNHEPTTDEISRHLNIPVEKIDQYRLFQQSTISLNDTYDKDHEMEWLEKIKDPNVEVEKTVISKISQKEVLELLKNSNLTKKEMTIIYYLFGFDGHGKRTCAEVGKIVNITRQAVSQTAILALEKLREMYFSTNDISTPSTNTEKLDYKTRKLFKNVEAMMTIDDYQELRTAINKARENDVLKSLRMMDLIILLLATGCVNNKKYPMITISNILRVDYDGIRNYGMGLVDRYSHIIDKLFEIECNKHTI